jgi:hypothetical protein
MILKRILTRKSILGFGTAATRDLSVQMMLDWGRKDFLITAYYNLDKIGFADDILDELGVTPEYRIDKPGKDEVMRNKFFSDRLDKMSEEEKMIYFRDKKINRSYVYNRAAAKDITKRTDVMRAKNHNNFKLK